MTLTVALACESESDLAIYRFLASAIIERPVVVWTGDTVFRGCSAVGKLASAFLARAEAFGICHALLAIDNDGRSKARLEHDGTHVLQTFDGADNDRCRECWLTEAAPPSWRDGAKLVVAVPVQTIETWLLCVRGTAFTTKTPEHQYDRKALKNSFGLKGLPEAERIRLAMAELEKDTALATLRTRASFRRFEARLAAWRSAPLA